MLLPYLDQATVFNGINFSGAAEWVNAAPQMRYSIPVFLCPSDSRSPNGDFAPINYGCSMGANTMYDYNPTVSPLSRENMNGMFTLRYSVRMRDISDGSSNTIAMAEQVVSQTGGPSGTPADLSRIVKTGSDTTWTDGGYPDTFATKANLDAFATPCSTGTAYYNFPRVCAVFIMFSSGTCCLTSVVASRTDCCQSTVAG